MRAKGPVAREGPLQMHSAIPITARYSFNSPFDINEPLVLGFSGDLPSFLRASSSKYPILRDVLCSLIAVVMRLDDVFVQES